MAVSGVLIFMIGLLVIGMPVAFAMAVAGAIGLFLIGGWPMASGFLSSSPMTSISSYELLTIPMFMLMAEFVIVSKIADELFDSVKIWVGRLPGGLAVAAALAGAGFGAICGSSTASAAMLSSTSIPAMVRNKYNMRYASGAVAISGTLAMLIPPSVALILYGLITETSIAKLLIAGIVPGIIVTLAIVLTLIYLAVRHPELVPNYEKYTMEQKLSSLKTMLPIVLLIFLVTGSIYTGIATPTEASGLGAFGAFLVAAVRGRLNWDTTLQALTRATRTSCMLLMIVIGAKIFGFYFTLTGVTQELVGAVAQSGVPSWLIITFIIGMFLVLGFFMDQVAILFLAVPITFPVVMSLGYDPIWFGIIVILAGEVGMVTPPVGINVFVVHKVSGIPTKDIFHGVTPHVLVHLLLIAFMAMFPPIVTWLPG